MTEEKDAWSELLRALTPGETVEFVVFGDWGYGGYDEPEPTIIPLDKRKILLDAGDAEPFMHGWSFYGGFGSPTCYAVKIWTNRRVFWVHEYDGSTSLASALRNPEACDPGMSG